MKFITVIFNILITKALCNPVYTYQLRGMYEKEKNMYFNNTVDAVFNQIHNIIIYNAKQNGNTTYFDFWFSYFLNKQQKNNNYECTRYYEYNYYLKYSQNNQFSSLTHYHFPQDVYDGYHIDTRMDPLPYNIPIEAYISKIIEMLKTNFPDCNLVKINEPQICYDVYLISW